MDALVCHVDAQSSCGGVPGALYSFRVHGAPPPRGRCHAPAGCSVPAVCNAPAVLLQAEVCIDHFYVQLPHMRHQPCTAAGLPPLPLRLPQHGAAAGHAGGEGRQSAGPAACSSLISAHVPEFLGTLAAAAAGRCCGQAATPQLERLLDSCAVTAAHIALGAPPSTRRFPRSRLTFASASCSTVSISAQRSAHWWPPCSLVQVRGDGPLRWLRSSDPCWVTVRRALGERVV